MDEHFCAFSFVDRITTVPPGPHIRGEYTIPASVEQFSLTLVAEAVGQLAAWSAMAALDFQRRPVAGLAGRVEFLAPVRPGQRLELFADLETVEADATAYDGGASVEGVPIIRLEHCVGPMMPVADFDDPAAVRARFALLCAEGAAPGRFRGLPAIAPQRAAGEPGKWLRAALTVPPHAGFFADHFPRRPVFPGTLLLEANLQLVSALVRELPAPPGCAWKLRTVTDVKLRAFTPPGETLELEARLERRAETDAHFQLEMRKGPRMVGGARARLTLEPRP